MICDTEEVERAREAVIAQAIWIASAHTQRNEWNMRHEWEMALKSLVDLTDKLIEAMAADRAMNAPPLFEETT
jgi:hypothetical protein